MRRSDPRSKRDPSDIETWRRCVRDLLETDHLYAHILCGSKGRAASKGGSLEHVRDLDEERDNDGDLEKWLFF